MMDEQGALKKVYTICAFFVYPTICLFITIQKFTRQQVFSYITFFNSTIMYKNMIVSSIVWSVLNVSLIFFPPRSTFKSAQVVLSAVVPQIIQISAQGHRPQKKQTQKSKHNCN